MTSTKNYFFQIIDLLIAFSISQIIICSVNCQKIMKTTCNTIQEPMVTSGRNSFFVQQKVYNQKLSVHDPMNKEKQLILTFERLQLRTAFLKLWMDCQSSCRLIFFLFQSNHNASQSLLIGLLLFSLHVHISLVTQNGSIQAQAKITLITSSGLPSKNSIFSQTRQSEFKSTEDITSVSHSWVIIIYEFGVCKLH